MNNRSTTANILSRLNRNGFWTRHYLIRDFLIQNKHYPVFGSIIFLLRLFYSYHVSFRIFGMSLLPRVRFPNRLFPVKVKCQKYAQIVAAPNVMLIFDSFLEGVATTSIFVGESGRLVIRNCFTIGDGCKIKIGREAVLTFEGNGDLGTSGMTCAATILCHKEIYIGSATILSWNTYITDSSQHAVDGQVKVAPVYIGNHVWISEGVSVAPGSKISDGCVVGSKSFVRGVFPEKTMIVGIPARIKKHGVRWGH